MNRMKVTAALIALLSAIGLAGCDQRGGGSPAGDQSMERGATGDTGASPDSGAGSPSSAPGDTGGGASGSGAGGGAGGGTGGS